MTRKQMKTLKVNIFKKIQKTREDGQKEYARDKDNAFANFERVADNLSISREKVLLTYLLKHIDGICAHVEGHESQREDITGRITDSIVYLCLFWGMIEGSEYPGKSKHYYNRFAKEIK